MYHNLEPDATNAPAGASINDSMLNASARCQFTVNDPQFAKLAGTAY